jgi:hypothetical protein
MAAESIGHKLAELNTLRSDPRAAESVELIRKSLADPSNRVVERAAELVAEAELTALAEDSLAAYRRLLVDPIVTDPGCAAKTAILRALVRLEHKDAELYRAAIGYEQLEPVWGGAVDAAAELRGIAAAGLVNCATSFEVLNRCAVLLADEWPQARIGAAHAIAVLAQLEGAALLRLKLLTGDEKPEVVGACCTALLRLDREEGVGFVSRFLESPDPDVCIQAALTLAESRRPGVFELLRSAWDQQQDGYARESMLVCMGLLRSAEAVDFLLALIDRKNLRIAAEAIKVLKTCPNTDGLRQRVVEAVDATGSADLTKTFRKTWQGEH